ncbi:hypothetical protein C8J55DRAFT_558603 [Lentinula edodes]|uniref:SUN domain-containing protein n=1 Tax=Lentinula lateritia TaxID=40482 RepID=A0A9W9AMM8_9AGAR|nr:hypothetical protein C8J55DRAFT_558603 [Lentinula edodes]
MSNKRGLHKWRFVMPESSMASIPKRTPHSPSSHSSAPSTPASVEIEEPRVEARTISWSSTMTRYAVQIITLLSFISGCVYHVSKNLNSYFPNIHFHIPPRILLYMCYLSHILCTMRMFLLLDGPQACDGDCVLQPPAASSYMDRVQQQQQQLTENALDYALALRGGAVLMDLTSDTAGITPLSQWQRWLGYVSSFPDYADKAPPLAVLEQEIHVGYCWAFLGPRGHIAFALSEPIVVTDFTIFYANPNELTTKELQQAPKIIQLWALSAPKSSQNVVQQKQIPWKHFAQTNRKPLQLGFSNSFELLANVSFTLQQGTKQTFSVEAPTKSLTTVVVIEVLDNWGSETTCLYRIAIHGKIPS